VFVTDRNANLIIYAGTLAKAVQEYMRVHWPKQCSIAPYKVIQESLGFRVPRCGFRIPCLWIPDSTSMDSGFHKWLDFRFQNSIRWFSTFPLYFVITKKLVLFFYPKCTLSYICNGNRPEWSPIRSVIIRVLNKIGRPRSGSPICSSRV